MQRLTRLCLVAMALGACAQGKEKGSTDANPMGPASDAADLPMAEAGTGGTGGAARTAPLLPTVSGPCPDFITGDVTFTPIGVASRKVRLWVGEKAGGPLIFYWHGTGSSPAEVEAGLAGQVAAITSGGGIVAALYTGSKEGIFPWLSTTEEALKIADEVVACAIQKKGIDTSHIHTMGMSAGGLMTSAMGIQRSNYIASVAPYSGGSTGPAEFQNPSNKFAALIFYGGPRDVVIQRFETSSKNFNRVLRDQGHYALLCNHGGGHSIPAAGPAAAWRFFQDHPYGKSPSPYAGNTPPAPIPSYCIPDP